MPFPSDFNHGGDINVTVTENAALQDRMRVTTATCAKPPHWVKAVPAARQRKYFRLNRLYVNEDPLKDIANPEQYWRSVVDLTPMKEWVNPTQVFRHLAHAHPRDKPSNYKFWSQMQKFLLSAIEAGDQCGWADNAQLNVAGTSEALWDAIRIVGDARDGYGTYPRLLQERMVKAGFCWIAVDSSVRIISKCWGSYAQAHKLKYAAAVSVQRAGSSGNTKQETEKRTDAADANVRDSGNGEGPSESRRTVSTEYTTEVYVPSNEKASAALQKFLALTPKPVAKVDVLLLDKPSQSFPTIAERTTTCENNLDKIAKHQIALRNNLIGETQNFVTSILKDAIMGGPIEARMGQVLNDAIHKIEQNIQIRVDTAIKEEGKRMEALCREEIERAIKHDHRWVEMENELNVLQSDLSGVRNEVRTVHRDVEDVSKPTGGDHTRESSGMHEEAESSRAMQQQESHAREMQSTMDSDPRDDEEDDGSSQNLSFNKSLW